MKLNHIAITITDFSEIKDFYKDLLGMKDVRQFTLNKNLSKNIFGLEKETIAYLLQKDELFFEIFILPQDIEKGFNHICFSVPDREEIVKQAKHKNYVVTRIEREHFDLIFVKDKSGNIFEIKQD